MNQFDMVKYKMTRVNNILEISELKWVEQHNLIQMATISPPVGEDPLEEME